MRTATTAIAILIVSTFATSHAVAQDQRVASATRSVPECDSNDRTVEVALDKSGQSNPAVNARGVLSEDIVEDVVRERLADIRACYVDALERDPELSGGVEVVWDIGRDGDAMCTSVRAPSETFSGLAECLRGQLATLQFAPASSDSVRVRYPIEFAAPRPE